MIESRVAGKYAHALFSAAKKIKQVDTISVDLGTISRLLTEIPHLKILLESPQILEKEKRELISNTFRDRISEVLLSFLLLVLSKHRIAYLLPMADEFGRLVKEDQGIVTAQLITVRQLEPALMEDIVHELEKTTGKKIELKTEIDPSLIGGIVIVLGDKIIDRSIRYRLNQFKEQMSALRVY